MTLDLLSYQLAHEQSLIKAAHFAYAQGNLQAAVGFITSLAALLGVELPKRPLATYIGPGKSIADANAVLDRYFHACNLLVSKHLNKNIEHVRASYAAPFSLKGAGTSPRSNSRSNPG